MSNLGVNNISSHTLSPDERITLSLGPKFVLPHRLTHEELKRATSDFEHRAGWWAFHTLSDAESSSDKIGVHNPRLKLRPSREERKPLPRESIPLSILQQLDELKGNAPLQLKAHYRTDHSARRRRSASESFLDRAIHRGRKSLLENQDVIVKLADKNLGPTAMDLEWYVSQCHGHLKDTQTYTPVDEFNFDNQHYTELVMRIVEAETTAIWHNRHHPERGQAKPICMVKDLQAFLLHPTLENTQVPDFYITPKLHKNPVGSRPISASHSFIYTHLAIWVAERLAELAANIRTVCTNSTQTTEALRRLTPSPNNHILVGDVTALYPSIPINQGVDLVRTFLAEHTTWPSVLKEAVCDALHLCLSEHHTQFDGQCYKQISGTAMGVQFAPHYANIVLFMLESELADSLPLYQRYIDDILAVGSRATLESFREQLNTSYATLGIHIVWEPISQAADFLDVHVELNQGPNGSPTTRTFSKPMHPFLYIPFASAHPRDSMRGWIMSEITRHRTLCSTFEALHSQLLRFYKNLVARGYPRAFLNPIFRPHFFTRPPSPRDAPPRSLDLARSQRRTPNPNSLALVVPHSSFTESGRLRRVINTWPGDAPGQLSKHQVVIAKTLPKRTLAPLLHIRTGWRTTQPAAASDGDTAAAAADATT